MEIDKKVLEHLKYISQDEKKVLLKLIDTARTEPNTLLILAIFRDVYVTSQMMKSYILRLESKIRELESKIDDVKLKGE